MSLLFWYGQYVKWNMLKSFIIILYKGENFKHIFRWLMADKRKSLSKCHYWHRRSRRSTPDLLFPYFPGPELFVLSPMSAVQTMPVYLISRSGSSLSNTSPFITGYSSFVDSLAPFDLNLVSSNFGLSHTKSDIVEDLLIQHNLIFHHVWIGVSLPGPVFPTQLLFSMILQFLPVGILVLTFKDSIKTSGFQTIH